MRIAIDCADLDHKRIDGTRVYIKNLLSWLGQKGPEDQFLLYHQKEFNPLLKPKMFSNYIDRKIPYRMFWTQTRFAFELRQEKPDVCWMPIQQIPLIGPEETKFVVTIHDLAFKFYPKHFPQNDLLKIDFFTNAAIKRADRIIAISEATKKDILKLYPKVEAEKIHVVHHGFEKEIFEKEYRKEEIGEVLKNYKLQTTNYLLYVGAIQPRKNLVTLIKAFNSVRENIADLKLVLAGEIAWKAESTMEAAEKSKYKTDIIFTGRVDFEDLAKLYQGAKIFVFPPLYEGFGIPVLEAFASRVPVVIADNSSLPEVAEDAAEKFEGENHEQLAGILLKLLENSTMREAMVQKGLERVKHFSWEKCAQETLDVLKS